MMLVGLIWAACAPLVLVLAVVLLARVLRRRGLPWAGAIAATTVLVPVASLWWLDHAEFRAVCRDTAAPVVHRTAKAEGIFLNSSTANSFGMRYLQEEGFAWVEAPSIYTRGAFVRYAKRGAAAGADSARIDETEIPALSARYEVREVFRQPYPHTGLSETQVVDRTTGEVLASAGRASFDGGRAQWVLGAWGSTDCPSVVRAPDAFQAYYHLAKRTLR